MFKKPSSLRFKGKTIEDSSWLEGSYDNSGGVPVIHNHVLGSRVIDLETLEVSVAVDETGAMMFTGDVFINRTEDGDFLSVLVLSSGESTESFPLFMYSNIGELNLDNEDSEWPVELGIPVNTEVNSTKLLGNIRDLQHLVQYSSKKLQNLYPFLEN